jgi:hypothetical protein
MFTTFLTTGKNIPIAPIIQPQTILRQQQNIADYSLFNDKTN